MQRIGIVGGGIVGLALAHHLASRNEELCLTVFEKEKDVGMHQTSHNSGVIHAGVYYAPGSLKATLCRRGGDLLRAFCKELEICFDEVGKLIVASTEDEIERLDAIELRARENGVPDIRRLDQKEIAELEPNVVGLSALHSPHTGIVDFHAVAKRFAELLEANGHEVLTGSKVDRVVSSGERAVVLVDGDAHAFDRVIVCAGLGTWNLSRASKLGAWRSLRIVPFRGEFYRLTDQAKNLVNGLVYPVPDPRYPFLGIHFTRDLEGGTFIGPNAVLALSLEGYTRSQVDPRLLASLGTWPGAWRMARANWRAGVHELYGSFSKAEYVKRARTYVPALRASDVVRAPSGVRAQAVDDRGQLLDDFRIEQAGSITVVYNAPSPAATSSMAIAEHISTELLGL